MRWTTVWICALMAIALGGCQPKAPDASTKTSAPIDNTPIPPPTTSEAYLKSLNKMPPPTRRAYVNANRDEFQKFYDQADEATKAKLDGIKPTP